MPLGYRLAPRHFPVGHGIVLGCLLALACGDTTMDTGSESSAGGAGVEMIASGGGNKSTPMGVGGTESIENGGSPGGSRDAAVSGSGGTQTGGAGGAGGTQAAGIGGAQDGGTGGARDGGSGGKAGSPSGNGALFFDDFTGSSLDSAKWTGGFDRQSDTANGERNAVLPANVTVSGGNVAFTAKHQDATSGDRNVSPPHAFVGSTTLYHYTSGQIQQATAPFLYGTVEARLKLPAMTGAWPCFWMLGFEWQASQPYTANVAGHNWPYDGWFEIDIAEFFAGYRNRVRNESHWQQTGAGEHYADLVADASTRFMVFRLQWQPNSLIWSYDAEDGVGFRTTRTVTGAGNVPNQRAYIVLNMPVGGNGSGPIVDSDYPQSMLVDWVRVTQ